MYNGNPPIWYKHKNVFNHHAGTTGRALSSWHELGLTLPSKTVAPQGLADILEQHERKGVRRNNQDPPHSSCTQSSRVEKHLIPNTVSLPPGSYENPLMKAFWNRDCLNNDHLASYPCAAVAYLQNVYASVL